MESQSFIFYFFPKISKIRNGILNCILFINSSIAISLFPTFIFFIFLKFTSNDINYYKIYTSLGVAVIVLSFLLIYGTISAIKLFSGKNEIIKSGKKRIGWILSVGSICMLTLAICYPLFVSSELRMLFQVLADYFQNFYLKMLTLVVMTSAEFMIFIQLIGKKDLFNQLKIDFKGFGETEQKDPEISQQYRHLFSFMFNMMIIIFFTFLWLEFNGFIYDFLKNHYNIDLFQVKIVKVLLGFSIIFIHLSYLIDISREYIVKKEN